MKILIMSDTHFKNSEIPKNISSVIRPDPEKAGKDAAANRPDMVIHAGDFSSAEAFRALKSLCDGEGIQFRAVCGNCDPAELARLLPEKMILEEEGLRIGVIHEAGRSFDENTARWYLLKQMNADILIFGHIHCPVIDSYDGKYLICPGSPTRPRLSDPSMIMMEIGDGKVKSIRPVMLGRSMCGCIRFCDELSRREQKDRQ